MGFNMSESEDVNCSLTEFIERKGLSPGMIIFCENAETIIVGNCTPFIQPTDSDGGIGWDRDYTDGVQVRRIEYYAV